jgi:CheY-like chemotaxis protein
MRLAGLTVLLVEDDIDNLELLGSFIEAEGACVLSAGSIVAALALSLGHHVDVVVSDLELADGDGCALLKQLKVREARLNLPAIAVTGYSEERWRARASACGFERFLVKPFALDALVSAIAEVSGTSARVSSVRDAAGQVCHAVAHPAAPDLARR